MYALDMKFKKMLFFTESQASIDLYKFVKKILKFHSIWSTIDVNSSRILKLFLYLLLFIKSALGLLFSGFKGFY